MAREGGVAMRTLFPWVLRLLVVVVVIAAGFALVCGCGGDAEPAVTPSSSPWVSEDSSEEDATEHATAPAGNPSGGLSSEELAVEPHPATLAWEPTGEYRTELRGIGLTVHTFVINPDDIAIVYSLDDSESGLDMSPGTVALTDDLDQSYDVVSNTVLGSTLGVTAGLLTAEPYKGEGKTLTLTVTDVTTSAGDAVSGKTVSGDWSVTFVENRDPGAPVNYSEGGRIAPAVVRAGEITMGMGGPSPQPVVELLVSRGGREEALYGGISDGVAGPLTEEEFHEQLKAYTGGVDNYPPPEGWPEPAEVVH
jgi:hypothetical protein